jgi:FKBP-type peptidyl-prolyl cis-trans isomerase SlpA
LGNAELAPAIEARLLGLAEGEHVTLHMGAGEAFVERNPDMLQWVPKQLLATFGDADASYLLGEVVEFPAPDNAGKYAGAVAQLGDDAILFDFNHPLAGQAVSMEVHVIGVL